MSLPSFTTFATWLRGKPLVGDLILAGGVLGFAFLGRAVNPTTQHGLRNIWLWLGWSLLGLVPIVLRRERTRTAVAIVIVTGVVGSIIQWNSTESFAVLIVTYTVAAHWELRRALLTAAVLWVPSTVFYIVLLEFRPAPPELGWFASTPAIILFNGTTLLLTLLIGRYMHTRRLFEVDLRERARIAEATQQALADQAVADERRRIARELHDVVAHHVSVMGILATGARRSMASNPAAADAALETIEETGRTTLRELRRLLNILRTDDEQADMTPQPGLAAVEALVDQLREAGLPVRLIVDGEPYDLDPGIALTLYRIVQEALTNTLKHAGKATADVRFTFTPTLLEVEVLDDGRGPSVHPNRSGHGLVGIRERVGLYGGQLRLGPRPGGGFRIAATIPIDRPGSVTERE